MQIILEKSSFEKSPHPQPSAEFKVSPGGSLRASSTSSVDLASRLPGLPSPGSILHMLVYTLGFPGGTLVKNLPANAGDAGDARSISVLGRPPGEGNGTPLQYSCLENPIDRGAWRATARGVKRSWT